MKAINYKLCYPQNLMAKPWLIQNPCNNCNPCKSCNTCNNCNTCKSCNTCNSPDTENKPQYTPTKPEIQNSNSTENIIESIALMETALSHILNAEGEKIQKILATSDDCQEIMDVNQSVHQVIISVTHLEQILYQKLNLAQKLKATKA